MRTLVTGGAGFIGSHLVTQLLADGHSVIVLDNFSTGRQENLTHLRGNNDLRLVQIDITNLEKIKQYFEGIDWVFHLAALADIVPSITEPIKYFDSNVNGTAMVLEASRLANVKRFIYTASSSCYGIPDYYPTAETAEIRPQYPYALTKWLGEQSALHWSKVYKMPLVAMRLFNVYGPRSRTSGTYGAVFGVFLAQKIHGHPFTVVGDGSQARDFTFVTDVAKAFIKAAESDITGEAFNVGTGHPRSINEIVNLLVGEVVHIPKRPGEPDCTHADINKIIKMLGWKPQVSLEEGIKILLDDIDYWQQAPVWTPATIAEATNEWFKNLS
ncbi:MAG: SDR family oxidoreductase [Patescibacteria group bacterium]